MLLFKKYFFRPLLRVQQ